MELPVRPGLGGEAGSLPGQPRDALLDRYIAAVVVASALSTPLSFYSLGFAYQALIGCALALLFFRRLFPTALTRTLSALFALDMVCICAASVLYDESPAAVVTVVVRYWAPVLFVAMLIAVRARPGEGFFVGWYRLLLLLTLVSYLQYFFSPNLWGLIPTDFSTLTEWSEGKSFAEYALFYRATSLLGSPQVWGAYSALSIFVLAERLKGRIGIAALCFLWGGAMLSGNKVSAVILFAFLAMRAAKSAGRMAAAVAVPLLLYVFLGDYVADFRAIEHVLNFADIADQEQEGRLAIWAYVIGHINPILGGGASFVRDLSEVHHFVAESYLLQSWAEATIVFPLVFLFLIARAVFLPGTTHQKAFACLVLVATIVSHAFSHPAFIVFWPVLLGLKFSNEK